MRANLFFDVHYLLPKAALAALAGCVSSLVARSIWETTERRTPAPRSTIWKSDLLGAVPALPTPSTPSLRGS